MTFQDAKDLAIEFGAKLPKFDHTSPVAQCWIDQIEYLPVVAAIPNTFAFIRALKEANRYAG